MEIRNRAVLGGLVITSAVALLLTFTACEQAMEPPGPNAPSRPPVVDEKPTEPTAPAPTKPTDPRVRIINPQGTALSNELHTLDLGTVSAEVFVVSTNTTNRYATSTIERLDTITPGAARSNGRAIRATASGTAGRALRSEVPAWVTEFNNNPPLSGRSVVRTRSQSAQSRSSVVVGNRFTFVYPDRQVLFSVPATARRVVRDGTTTLAVWVADREWGSYCGFASWCLTQEMVDAVAYRFLRPGAANDIYDWVTAIFGAPWGPHPYYNLIPPEAAREIHILLFDIAGDGPPRPGDARIMGFFVGLNNYQRQFDVPQSRGSNERLTFYIDSPVLASRDGPVWTVTDGWPSLIIQTLAHEFQHMIHFYQKAVLQDVESEVWLNEMASEVAVDLIADKMKMDGPRGVAHDDPGAGVPGTVDGRLPLYNLNNDRQVTAWFGELEDYAMTYALGAYLARTYGGAQLFRAIVQNDQGGIGAVEAALAAHGHEESFGDVLTNWGVANLLSDDPSAPHPYRYNAGSSWVTSEAGGAAFRLGSINLFNYRYEFSYGLTDYYHDGPYLYSLSEFNEARAQLPHSNRYVSLGRNTGRVRLRIDASAGNRITVVVKG